MERRRLRRHDAAYKRLFSHPEMVADLLRGWISEPWADRVRPETLKKVPSEFVTSILERRLSDCVWRFELQDGEEVCLLLEFQSSVERRMPARLLVYLALLLEQALRIGKPSGFPARVAIAVVYNGDRKWDAPLEFSALFAESPDGESRVFCQFRYLVVEWHGAGGRDDLIGLLFALERAGDEELEPLLERLRRRLRGEGRKELRRSFRIWLNEVLLPERNAGWPELDIPGLEEDMIHLPERIAWKEEALRKGREEGLEAGRVGLARSVLEERFGALSDDQLNRLRDADPRQLAAWVGRSYSCGSLLEVFES